ncbi:hypothetical protein D6827_00620 [Candidatus Parcubacteria bacterium]|nr:MAG: hypothetical protein D6827_00620 [Candidatus Parcubacteria bacterium]
MINIEEIEKRIESGEIFVEGNGEMVMEVRINKEAMRGLAAVIMLGKGLELACELEGAIKEREGMQTH